MSNDKVTIAEEMMPLSHGRCCSAGFDLDADCTCGLQYRIYLQTEQELHAAWRKRAEEAEAERDALREQTKPKCPDCNSVHMAHCSDPVNCGGVYWPDRMYRAVEAENRRLKAPVTDDEARVSFETWNCTFLDATKWDELEPDQQERWKNALVAARGDAKISAPQEPK